MDVELMYWHNLLYSMHKYYSLWRKGVQMGWRLSDSSHMQNLWGELAIWILCMITVHMCFIINMEDVTGNSLCRLHITIWLYIFNRKYSIIYAVVLCYWSWLLHLLFKDLIWKGEAWVFLVTSQTYLSNNGFWIEISQCGLCCVWKGVGSMN